MNLALFPPLGGSLTALRQTGQLPRLVASYLPAYAQAFDEIHYFSYGNEEPADFPDTSLPKHFHLLGNAHADNHHRYAWRMVHQHAGPLATCAVSRVFQATGIVPAWLAKRRFGIPIVTTYGYHYARMARSQRSHGRALYYTLLERLALRVSNAILVTTAPIADYVRQMAVPERVHLIPNGVDLQQFYPAAHRPEGRPTVIYVGRLSAEKNLASLLRAAHRLQPAIQLQVTFVGDGPLRTALAQQAAELGVELRFNGMVSHDRLPALLRSAHAFVLPSFSEGHPKALLEAMACGLPVVVSDIPGNRSLVEPGVNGQIFPVDDDAQLAIRLATVVEERALAERLGRMAYQTIVEGYDLETLVGREVALLRALGTGHAGS